jgi:hypothetical protein
MSGSRIGLAKRLDPERRVREGSVSLNGGPKRHSVTATIDLEAIRHAGRDPDAPGSCSWFYLPDLELIAFDLGGQFSEREE